MIFGRNKGAEDDVGKRQHHIEIIEVSLVMHMVMRVQPTEPSRRFEPAPFGNMHAVMEVFVKKIVEDECRQGAYEYVCCQRPLYPKNDGRVKNDNKRSVPPGEANLANDLCVGKKVVVAGPEKTMVNQGMGAKGILPKRRVH